MVRPLAARAKGPGFDSPIAQYVRRLIFFRAFTHGAIMAYKMVKMADLSQPVFVQFTSKT